MTDERIPSNELQPGTVMVHRNGDRVELLRRKLLSDDRDHGLTFWPGWVLTRGGGLADFVIDAEDSDWTPARAARRATCRSVDVSASSARRRRDDSRGRRPMPEPQFVFWCKLNDGRIIEHTTSHYENHHGHVRCRPMGEADD